MLSFGLIGEKKGHCLIDLENEHGIQGFGETFEETLLLIIFNTIISNKVVMIGENDEL